MFRFRGNSLCVGEILVGLGSFFQSLPVLFPVQSSRSSAFCQCTSGPYIRQGTAYDFSCAAGSPCRAWYHWMSPTLVTMAPYSLLRMDPTTRLAGGLLVAHPVRGLRCAIHQKPLTHPFPPKFLTLANFSLPLLPIENHRRGQDLLFSTIRCAAVLSILLLDRAVFPEFVLARKAVTIQSASGTQAAKPNPVDPTTSAGKELTSKTFTLAGSKVWMDTGITLEPGQRVVVTADGTLRYSDAKSDNGPEGLTRGYKDLIRVLPLNSHGRGALIAKIGDPDVAEPFFVGASKDAIAPISGKLFIGINQSESDTGAGSYTVKLEVYASSDTTPREVARVVQSMPGVDNALFSRIPRRISDKQGDPGDMVNFLIIGDEDQMKKVFIEAGWIKVDADVKDTILSGFLASMSKDSYLTMPMSPLYLFDRHQDYGWAHAEPIAVVASRNHLRIWKAPFLVNGQVLWVGAATHDIGFEKDQRNNSVTHKIDPDIDLERNYVEKTLSSTGLVTELMHFLPQNPMTTARTATGGSFHSNGQVLILKLTPALQSVSTP